MFMQPASVFRPVDLTVFNSDGSRVVIGQFLSVLYDADGNASVTFAPIPSHDAVIRADLDN